MLDPHIAKLVAHVATSTDSHAATRLRDLGKGVISCVLGSRDALDAVAQRSYSHPNGFQKIVLLPSCYPSAELRLHIWNSWIRDEDCKIHNHAWNFSSLVLCGALENVTYEVGEGSALRAYRVEALSSANGWASANYTISDAGNIPASESLRVTMAEGTYYRQRAEVFHRVAPRTAFCATLVAQEPFQSSGSFILTERGMPAAVETVPMTAATVAHLLSHIIEMRTI